MTIQPKSYAQSGLCLQIGVMSYKIARFCSPQPPYKIERRHMSFCSPVYANKVPVGGSAGFGSVFDREDDIAVMGQS
jgi:hypothetical protein